MAYITDLNYIVPQGLPPGMSEDSHRVNYRNRHMLTVADEQGFATTAPGLYWLAALLSTFVPFKKFPAVVAAPAADGVEAVLPSPACYCGELHWFQCLLSDVFYLPVTGDRVQDWNDSYPFRSSIGVAALERVAVRLQVRMGNCAPLTDFNDWMVKLREAEEDNDAVDLDFLLQQDDLLHHCMVSSTANFLEAGREVHADLSLYTNLTFRSLCDSKGRLHMLTHYLVRAGPLFTPQLMIVNARSRFRQLGTFLQSVDPTNFPKQPNQADDWYGAAFLLQQISILEVPFFLRSFDARPFHDAGDMAALGSCITILEVLQWHLGDSNTRQRIIKRHIDRVVTAHHLLSRFCNVVGEKSVSTEKYEVLRSLAGSLGIVLAVDSVLDYGRLNSALTPYSRMFEEVSFVGETRLSERLSILVERLRVIKATSRIPAAVASLSDSDGPAPSGSSAQGFSGTADMAHFLSELPTKNQLNHFLFLVNQVDDPMRWYRVLGDAVLFQPDYVYTAKDTLWRQIVFGGKRIPVTEDTPGLTALYQACSDTHILRFLMLIVQFGNAWMETPFTWDERIVFNKMMVLSDHIPMSFLKDFRTGRWDKIDFYNDFLRIVKSADSGLLKRNIVLEVENFHVQADVEYVMTNSMPALFRTLSLDPAGASGYLALRREVMRVLDLAQDIRNPDVRANARARVASIMVKGLEEGGELFWLCARGNSPRVDFITDLLPVGSHHLTAALSSLEADIKRQLRYVHIHY